MENKFETAQRLNKDFADLYGDSIKPYVELPETATFEDIKKVVASNNAIGYEHKILVGRKPIIAVRKFTWKGNVAKTAYLHIFHVNHFENNNRVFIHWREQKDGTFKTM